MALCRLTLNWGNGEPVWINPDNVIALWSVGDGTSITTTGQGKDSAHTIFVTERPDQVAILIDQALQR